VREACSYASPSGDSMCSRNVNGELHAVVSVFSLASRPPAFYRPVIRVAASFGKIRSLKSVLLPEGAAGSVACRRE
jgi:hypothetical protein